MIGARSTQDVEHVRDRIAAHVAAELTSDADVIAATVSDRPFFPVMVRASPGIELTVLTDVAAIRSFYAERVGIFEISDSTRVAELRTDWYALHESVATVRHVGPYRGIPPTGRSHRVHSVVLFPVDHDGIVGELEWTSVDFARIFEGQPVTAPGDQQPSADPHIPQLRLDRARVHDELLDAWWQGRAADVTGLMAPGASWASEHVHSGAPLAPRWTTDDHTIDEIVRAIEPGQVLANRPLQRYASTWFSFAERVIELSDHRRTFPIRVASLLAFERDDAVGHLAYSVDVLPS